MSFTRRRGEAVRLLVEQLRDAVREEIDLDCHCATCRRAIDWDEVTDAFVNAVLALTEEEEA